MLAPGQKFSHFLLAERFEVRHKGEVWAAVDTRSGSEVALRMLGFGADVARMTRFRDEAQKLAALAHPGIAVVRETGEAEGLHFAVSDLVVGHDLTAELPAGGFDTAALLALAIPLVDAVMAAHGADVIHGDLKPRNVRVLADGSVKVLDFGLREMTAAAMNPVIDPSDAPTETLTQDRPLGPGTLPYAPPERIQMKPLDARADVYALGTMLYELACGERPFQGESPADLIVAVLKDEPTPLEQKKPTVPARLAQTVRRAMARDRSRRLQSARFLYDDLVALRDSGA